MGWIGDLWKTLSAGRQVDLALVSDLEIPGETFGGQAITADECYVEIYVESVRLEKARKFATKFHGTVYLFATMSREGEANQHLATLSKPEKLATLSDDACGKVITVSRRLVGPVAWRGGSLHLEMGLFAVKSGNLLTAVLNFVTEVSSTAGIGFVGAMQPFVPLVTKGIDMLAGQTADFAAEVGIDTDLSLCKSGTYAMIAVPKQEMDGVRLTVDKSDRKLLQDGKALERAFCVFSIRTTLQRPDFGEIPELREKYAAVQLAIRSNDEKRANEALTAFRLTALTSADLIPADASRLVEKAAKKVSDAFPKGVVVKKAAPHQIEPLSSIGLYD
jgi:hypothetical protein